MVNEGIYQTRHSENPANYCTDTGNKVRERLVLFSVLNLQTVERPGYEMMKQHDTHSMN